MPNREKEGVEMDAPDTVRERELLVMPGVSANRLKLVIIK
jgi:hypothetical protein